MASHEFQQAKHRARGEDTALVSADSSDPEEKTEVCDGKEGQADEHAERPYSPSQTLIGYHPPHERSVVRKRSMLGSDRADG
jgi:hypothetical protein